MHAHREIEPQPSASLAQTVLTVEHSGTEHERRHGAALRNLEAVTSRLAIHVPSPAVAAATFLPASPQIVVCRPPLSPFAKGGQLLPGSVIRHYRRGHLVCTWCDLECYLV